MTELGWGQLCALGAGIFFLALECVRLKRLDAAALEAFRLWGFMAVSVLTIWLALRIPDMPGRIGVALASPVLAALVVNNVYVALRRGLDRRMAA